MIPWLAQTARRHPNRPAVFWRGERWTYRELADRAAGGAARLAAAGVEPGDRVGWLADNSRASLLAIHATLWRGAVLVPFNPELADRTLEDQIDEMAPELMLADREPPGGPGAPSWLEVDELADGGRRVDPAGRPAEKTATIFYTSGTTGRPKPVPLTYANHRASAAASAFNLGVAPDDRWLACLPLFHIGGLAIAMRSVIYGTALDLVAGFETDAIARHLDERRVTLASFVPTMMRRLLETGAEPSDSLRAVLVGGGPVDGALREASHRRGFPVLPTWGMTETASQFATVPLDPDARRAGTVGPALPGGRLRIVDDRGRVCEPGELGEIEVRGPMVFDGYLGRPKLNRRAFRQGWFQTGDLGRVDSRGHLNIDARASARIVTGGENVDPREVASVLRAHEAVAEACVLGLQDAEWGRRVAAAVEADDPSVTADELESHCRRRLAGFKCPKRWLISETLPRTATHKPDRRRIRARFDSSERQE
jgi:O-succinylbenzoic acid--CoA ligase